MIGISFSRVVVLFGIALVALAIDLVIAPYFEWPIVASLAVVVWATLAAILGIGIVAVFFLLLHGWVYETVTTRRLQAGDAERLQHCIARLFAPAAQDDYLGIFSTDRERGFSLAKVDGAIQALFIVGRQEEWNNEKKIRSFFDALQTAPTCDTVNNDETDPYASRALAYPVQGDAAELTALTKRILVELCGISPRETIRVSH